MSRARTASRPAKRGSRGRRSTLVDGTALEQGLLITTSHCAADGFVPDQTLFAPAYVASDTELAEMIDRLAATLGDVDSRIKSVLR